MADKNTIKVPVTNTIYNTITGQKTIQTSYLYLCIDENDHTAENEYLETTSKLLKDLEENMLDFENCSFFKHIQTWKVRRLYRNFLLDNKLLTYPTNNVRRYSYNNIFSILKGIQKICKNAIPKLKDNEKWKVLLDEVISLEIMIQLSKK